MEIKNRKYNENEIAVIHRCTEEIIAPTIMSYVAWILIDAEKKGIKRLYFLARDGYLMRRAAVRLCEIYGLDIECRYLYCSRKAFNMPQYHISGSLGVEYLCRGGIAITFRKILERAELSETQICEIMQQTGRFGRGNEVLSYKTIQALKRDLASNENLLKILYENSGEQYKLTIAYLSQEGLLDSNINFAVVDSGWTGGIQGSLYRLLRSADWDGRLQGYYFGIYELAEENCRLMKEGKSVYSSYFFSPERNMKAKIHFNNNLFETVCSAPEGMTRGYIEENGIILPVLEMKENVNQEMILLTTEFFDEYMDRLEGKEALEEIMSLFNKREFMRFMTRPYREEVEIYGKLLFSDDTTEKQTRQLSGDKDAEKIHMQNVFSRIHNILNNKYTADICAWPEGRICMHGRMKAWYTANELLYKYIRYFRKELQYKKILKRI